MTDTKKVTKMTEEEAQKAMDALEREYNKLESQMVGLALEYNLELYLEGRGCLLLKDKPMYGLVAGEWFTSTMSCS